MRNLQEEMTRREFLRDSAAALGLLLLPEELRRREFVINGEPRFGPGEIEVRPTNISGKMREGQVYLGADFQQEPLLKFPVLPNEMRGTMMLLDGAKLPAESVNYTLLLVEESRAVGGGEQVKVGPETALEVGVRDRSGKVLSRKNPSFPKGLQTPAVHFTYFEGQSKGRSVNRVVLAFCDPETGEANLPLPFYLGFQEGGAGFGKIGISFPRYAPQPSFGLELKPYGQRSELPWGEVSQKGVCLDEAVPKDGEPGMIFQLLKQLEKGEIKFSGAASGGAFINEGEVWRPFEEQMVL